jgi:restriction endonuclease S subunit
MKDKKDLLSSLRSLEQENKKLRKELAKYRKYSNKFADLVFESWEENNNPKVESEENSKKIKNCENCGKGELRNIAILGINFTVCQLCKSRKKLE